VDEVVDVLGDDLASDATIVETLLTASLVVIAWAAWLMIAASIVTEAIALARGTAARRIPVPPGVQQAAARVVASCALVVSSFSSSMPAAAVPIVALDFDTPGAADALVVEEPAPHRDTSHAESVAAAPLSEAASSGAGYVVEYGDTFWSIAERHLGDGLRWSEILSVALQGCGAGG
jgi:LysM repeat protein